MLSGVAVGSANDIWAVGNYYNASLSIYQVLIEHWDGTSWSAIPNPSLGVSELKAVAAISSVNVWAVGDDYNSANLPQTLIEQYS